MPQGAPVGPVTESVLPTWIASEPEKWIDRIAVTALTTDAPMNDLAAARSKALDCAQTRHYYGNDKHLGGARFCDRLSKLMKWLVVILVSLGTGKR